MKSIVVQAAPAARFSRTVAPTRHGKRPAGADGAAVLAAAGFTNAEIEALRAERVLMQNQDSA